VHGIGKIEAGLSDYYMVDEIQDTYRSLMIAIPPVNWEIFQSISGKQLACVLQDLAARVNLKAFLKQPERPKKKAPPVYNPHHPHVSTARLLAKAQQSP